jgi:hypothetical protein
LQSVREKKVKRIERVEVIHARIVALNVASGRWETPLPDQPQIKLRVIDVGNGCLAQITTPFSGLSENEPDPGNYTMAVEWEAKKAARLPNLTDLYINGGPKILSFAWTSDKIDIVSMTPGPWEGAFGLPLQPWAASAPEALRHSWQKSMGA